MEVAKGEGHFSEGLHGVGVKKNTALAACARDFLDRLYDAGLVVGGHE